MEKVEKRVKLLRFPNRKDGRGNMVIIEGNKDIPFAIQRVFYIFGTDKQVVRGQHANRESEFVLISIAGTCKVKVIDGKGEETVYCLDCPNMGLYLPKMIWKEMYDFSHDAILLVLSSTFYDANEYIRTIEEFERESSIWK